LHERTIRAHDPRRRHWDFVKVKDPSKPCTLDNSTFIELKFDGDDLTPNQRRARQALGEQASNKLLTVRTENCGCC
jgi:hypothetical protein